MATLFPTQVEAVLFDLDGTLLDSREDIAAACNHALRSAGRAALPGAEIDTFVGDGARKLVSSAFRLDRDAPEVTEHLERFLAYYAEHPLDHGSFYPGTTEVLRALEGVKLGICTNKSSAITRKILDKAGLGARFLSVIGGGDAGALKPNPAPVLLACSELGVSPERTIMVGDSEQDVLAARAAGCYAIGILGGFQSDARLLAAAPELTLERFSALEAHVNAWPLLRS